MPTMFVIPTSNYGIYPDGAEGDSIEYFTPVPAPHTGTLSIAELRFDLNSQLFTNVKVTITTSRQTLTPPHTVTPDPGEWTIDATSPPSVVFSRPQLPAGGATVSFKVGFTGSAPAIVLFTYRIEADQLVEPVDLVQLITVT